MNDLGNLMKNNPQIILKLLKETLTENSVDFETIVEELGQVSAAKRRSDGYNFTFEDHVKGLILAMLSNQRLWEPIARNMNKIDKIFFDYDPVKLENFEPEELVNQITSIKCGNRKIKNQMRSLSYNIGQLRKISREFGSLDKFVTNKAPEEVADILSNQNSEYKIKEIGMPLAMEYLKNVGISGMKPDTHLLRICGPERLDIIPSINAQKQLIIFEEFSNAARVSTTYLDNLFWIFGAKDYGKICSAEPKCDNCKLGDYCNYLNP